MRRLTFWRFLPLLAFVVLALFLWRGLSLDPHVLPSTKIGQPLPAFSLPTLQDPSKRIGQKDLLGQVFLLNVWASWCAACRDEQAFLLQLRHEGLPIIGVNYKDNVREAKRWLSDWGNPYQSIVVDKAGKLAIDLGVYGTPETFLIDKQGRIRYRHVGVLDEKIWQKAFVPRMHDE